MNTATRMQAFVGYWSAILHIYFSNKLVNWRFRYGKIDERRQILTHYILLKATRKANLDLLRYGFKRSEVDTKDWPELIRRCRRDTLAYIRQERKKGRIK